MFEKHEFSPLELLIPHDDTPPSLNLITLGLMITHQHQFVNLSQRNSLRLFPACCLGKGKLRREIRFIIRKGILNTWMHNKNCNRQAPTMYALEIVPCRSSVTSINPSQSHSPSSWITSNLILIIYKSKQTNLVLAEADGEVMTPHQLSHIKFLAFHLLKFAPIGQESIEQLPTAPLEVNPIHQFWPPVSPDSPAFYVVEIVDLNFISN